MTRLLTNAYSHNDYWRKRPLHDALDNGFCSVEADIFLVDGQLLVGHDRHELKFDRTLQSLYLNPLRDLARRNRNRIHPGGPSEFILLIDIKEEGEKVYQKLREVLLEYRGMMTEFRGQQKKPGAVTAILSGDRPRRMLEAEKVRYAAFDGRADDLDKGISPHFMPLVSNSWSGMFKWMGRGEMPDEERNRLHEFVTRAHKQGYKVRFWGAFDIPPLWEVQLKAGVDLINTDSLPQLREFLLSR